MALPPRQRRLEPDPEERPDLRDDTQEHRRTDQQPEARAVGIPEPQAGEHRDGAPRGAHRERRARSHVAGRFDREIDPHPAGTRIGAELGDGRRRGAGGEARAEHEAARAADDRAFVHEGARSGGPAVGRLRFELDEHHRWSLWYYGEGSPVPLVRGAEIVAWVGDRPLTLAELEDSTVGNRRPPGGDAVVVRGRTAGVWVEAELLTAGGASTPQASVTVTVFPDRYLPTVRGVRFFQLPHADVLAGDGPLTALVNGAHSADPTRVVTVGAPEAEGLASHAAVGLTRGSRGLAIAFDAGEPGEARVQLSRDALA